MLGWLYNEDGVWLGPNCTLSESFIRTNDDAIRLYAGTIDEWRNDPPPPRGNVSGEDAPLILTAQLPRDLHARFTALRTAHFPPERNYLEAHVTLFHALPAMCEAEACSVLKRMAAEFAPVPGQRGTQVMQTI